MLNKKVSIIIATRNRAESLKQLLESLKKIYILGDPNIEVVIIDNNSTDNSTLDLCNKYPVVYIKENRKGESFALNTGMKVSNGEYIINTDDDVIIKDKNWVEKLLQHFTKNKNLGYVSGNVCIFNDKNNVANLWEKKGGLSKGINSKLYKNIDLIKDYKMIPWPINKIAAGANNMISRKVFDKVGPYATFLGGGSPIGHGNSLEFVYRVIKAGYDVEYDSTAIIYHKHPTDKKSLKNKLYTYGVGNSAYQLYIFAKHFDFRSLYWGLLGHHLYVIKNLLKSFFKKYPLPPSYVLKSLEGSLIGTFSFILKYPFRNKKIYP
ncbi:MAG: glycosyltransferase family 2 protein [Candidatus Shapirobacteria bacterium]|nr:glycosyltransferase family 2 protein [Candidatus Shapirobacteria bacterium]MDD4410750.1 glycosyltransferase family 2 protein [Candidatus Shapirobacteria bacterium]